MSREGGHMGEKMRRGRKLRKSVIEINKYVVRLTEEDRALEELRRWLVRVSPAELREALPLFIRLARYLAVVRPVG
jgi:hypothetical protein